MEVPWRQFEGELQVNLSIRNVPDTLAEDLKVRAKLNHRSLQGELMAIITEAVTPKLPPGTENWDWAGMKRRLDARLALILKNRDAERRRNRPVNEYG
jgi:plasmid stability protein